MGTPTFFYKMGHSHGYRSGTRHSFSKAFAKKGGNIHLTQYLTPLRVGDYVDIKAQGSVHKGMPHKYYHGKTGERSLFARRRLSRRRSAHWGERGGRSAKRIAGRLLHFCCVRAAVLSSMYLFAGCECCFSLASATDLSRVLFTS